MKPLRFSSLRLILLVAALGIIMVSGSSVNWTFAQEDEEEAEDVPEGFKIAAMPAMPSAEEIEGGKQVYFTKCVWCHGVDGAGDGPAADRLWPRPRNFNQGTFKIRHTVSGELPLPDKDLLLTVTHGLPGSAMPGWEGILTEEQRERVIAFVTTQLIKDREFDDKEFESFTVLQVDDAAPPTPGHPESAVASRPWLGPLAGRFGASAFPHPLGPTCGCFPRGRASTWVGRCDR